MKSHNLDSALRERWSVDWWQKKIKKFNISLNFPKTKAVFTLIIFLRFKKQEKKKQQLIKNQKTPWAFDNCEPHAAGVSLKSQMAPQVQ